MLYIELHLQNNAKRYGLLFTLLFFGLCLAGFKPNQPLGTIIGEPTGNAPSSYGDAPSFQMPNTGFCFCVSHKKFVRPNPDNDPEDGLYSDILVNRTINDIIAGVDPHLENLKTIINIGGKIPIPVRELIAYYAMHDIKTK